MGLFDFIKKKSNEKKAEEQRKRDDLLRWQRIVMPDSPNELIMTEMQLKAFTQHHAANELRIVNDCASLIETTLNPDVFFMRLNLMMEKTKHLASLETFINFIGDSPSEAYEKFANNYQETVKQFLIRYFSDIFDKAETMKTEKGKLGKYQKFYDSLQQHYSYMNDENIDYIERKYKAYTRHRKG